MTLRQLPTLAVTFGLGVLAGVALLTAQSSLSRGPSANSAAFEAATQKKLAHLEQLGAAGDLTNAAGLFTELEGELDSLTSALRALPQTTG